MWMTSRIRSSRASAVAKKRSPSSLTTAMPGGCSSSGLLDDRRGRPGCRAHAPSTGDVRTRRHSDQPQQRQRDADHDAGEHAEDQGCRDGGRSRSRSRSAEPAPVRRISGTFIMPITTASMITAARTAFGRSENSGASTSSVSSTVSPRCDGRQAGLGTGVVVE